jgi:hypothetical protein
LPTELALSQFTGVNWPSAIPGTPYNGWPGGIAMLPARSQWTLPVTHLVVVRPEPPGQYTAQLVGLPELQATAATRDEALQQVRHLLKQWQEQGRLVPVDVPLPAARCQVANVHDPKDLLEREFLEDLERFRREDLERTLQEDDRECSNSSSTPIT